MANNILKEAIADAKAVREVALANAKAALEEAFTPKLQSMLSAKLSEELEDESMDEMMTYDEDEEMDEMMTYDEDESMDEMMTYDEDEEMDEMMTYDEDEEMDEMMTYDEDENMGDMDEEIDLEAILNELELEEDDSEEVMDENVTDIHEGACTSCNEANKDFNLDLLLQEINDLDKEEELDEEVNLEIEDDEVDLMEKKDDKEEKDSSDDKVKEIKKELNETKKALNTVRAELNEVNLLNSKLLYVNRIFKANNLDDPQKLRVVETLDKAESVKEAKLIYETIKDTFTISKTKRNKRTPKKSIREGLGMASKAAGMSTAPKKPILNESNDMVARMQKLANIKINE